MIHKKEAKLLLNLRNDVIELCFFEFKSKAILHFEAVYSYLAFLEGHITSFFLSGFESLYNCFSLQGQK